MSRSRQSMLSHSFAVVVAGLTLTSKKLREREHA